MGCALKIFHSVYRFVSLVVLLQPMLTHLIQPVLPFDASFPFDSDFNSSFFFFFFLLIFLRFRFHFLLVAVWSSISISIPILIYEEKACDLLGELINGGDSSISQIFYCNVNPTSQR
ncbi:hypothetical protein IC582_016573 [Cucumis melo]